MRSGRKVHDTVQLMTRKYFYLEYFLYIIAPATEAGIGWQVLANPIHPLSLWTQLFWLFTLNLNGFVIETKESLYFTTTYSEKIDVTSSNLSSVTSQSL